MKHRDEKIMVMAILSTPVVHNSCTVSHLSSNNLGGRTCLARKWFHRADTSTQPAKHVGGTGGGGKIGCKKW